MQLARPTLRDNVVRSRSPAPSHARIGVRRHLHRSLLIFRLLSYTLKAVAYLFSNYFVSLHMPI